MLPFFTYLICYLNLVPDNINSIINQYTKQLVSNLNLNTISNEFDPHCGNFLDETKS